MKLHEGTWLCEDGAVVAIRNAAGLAPWGGFVLGTLDVRYFDDDGHARWVPAGQDIIRAVVLADEDPDLYQQAALSTVRPGVDVELMCAVGLAGEVGEVCEPIKKHRFHGKPLDKQEMKKEIGDVLWYATVLAHHYGFKLSEIMRENREKLAARYAAMKVAREIDERADVWVRARLLADEAAAAGSANLQAEELLSMHSTRPETPDATVDVAEDGSTDRTVPVDRPSIPAGRDGEPSTSTEGSPEGVGLTGAPDARDDRGIDGSCGGTGE